MKENLSCFILICFFSLTSYSFNEVPKEWKIIKNWSESQDNLYFEATSNSIASQCLSTSGTIYFPNILYGSHEIYVDGQLETTLGDPKHLKSVPILGAPSLSCKFLNKSSTVTWKIYAYSKYFAQFKNWPYYSESKDWWRFFNETLYFCGGFLLIVLAIFFFNILNGKESKGLTWSLSLSCYYCGCYLIGGVLNILNFDTSVINIHRFSDSNLLIGFILLFNSFRIEQLIPNILFKIHVLFTVIGLGIILLGPDGDIIQYGTSSCFISAIICFVFLTKSQITRFKTTPNLGTGLSLFSSIIFLIGFTYEISLFVGVLDFYSFLPITFVICYLTMVLAVNQRILATYKQRDDLLNQLEQKVQERTKDLYSTLKNLKTAQAELVQSTKLASLGTLSAGIAHEINNSINYVNGAVLPLEKIIKTDVSESKKDIALKLMAAIKDGVKLTVDIVRALRTYTGLNQSELKETNIYDVFNSICTILKNKLGSRIAVVNNIPSQLTLFTNIISLNQIAMNLISNAIDAIPNEGTVTIDSNVNEKSITFYIRDSGTGIRKEILDKIYDPFYTTKEVGKGTGLGLYIVKNEVEKLGGIVEVETEINKGSTFKITIPIKPDVDLTLTTRKKEAA